MAVATYGIYALTNAWFISRGVGETAFVAVNLVAPLLLILGAVSTTVGVGGASLVSHRLGAGDPRGAARAAGNAFVVFWAAAVLIGGLGILLIEPLLTVLGAAGETRAPARDYALIILAGSLTATGFSSLVRAEGRMRFSTLIWVVSVVCQIVLDPLLIFGLDMGVRGAAFGTVGGQAVSVGLSLWFFFLQRDRPYRIGLADLRPHGPTLRRLVSLGAPSFLGGLGTTLVTALANVLLLRLGGAVALSAYAICARIGTFALMPQLGISQGMQPLIGYNAGRALADRVHRTRVLALRATTLYGAAACAVLLGAAGPLTGAFTDDPEVRDAAADGLRVLALGHPLAGVATLVAAYFQALGRARPSYLISIGSIVGVRVPLLLLASLAGTTWLWSSFPVAELVTAAAAWLILRRRGGAAGGAEAPKERAPARPRTRSP
ncbi:MATE family efflux transporter [Streptomyces sp. PT12]|uniref:MATE family efflux transporter n=1 Tax=Streptomyces sp. PT12 TaxID=1510197 RepID=UPI000DE25A37|nr:MATE family efflux transporter [Streptomyces sp. PT12]RBM18715.1 MATE family efflux transporter [Streptomyces sp. PT12]